MSDIWYDGKWSEALPCHALFTALAEELTSECKIVGCESRGDLFLWSPSTCSCLTTNLKRLHVRRDEANVYQVSH